MPETEKPELKKNEITSASIEDRILADQAPKWLELLSPSDAKVAVYAFHPERARWAEIGHETAFRSAGSKPYLRRLVTVLFENIN